MKLIRISFEDNCGSDLLRPFCKSPTGSAIIAFTRNTCRIYHESVEGGPLLPIAPLRNIVEKASG